MNKLIIPTILTATILIAGMFAFMPVEKAATVHTTATTNSNTQTPLIQTIRDADMTSASTCTATGPFLVHYNIGAVPDAATVTITAAGGTVVTTFDVDANQGFADGMTGTIGGAAGAVITFASSSATTKGIITIEAAAGDPTGLCAVA